LEYTPVGPRFSNAVLQALLVKLTHPPPNAKRRLMIIGTTNNFSAVESMEFRKVFKAVYEVPQVESGEEVKRVLRDTNTVVDDTQLGAIISCVHYPIGIQQLLMVIQLAVRFGNGQLTHENFAGALHNFNLDSPALLSSGLNTDFNF
jgi:vesicle-fusing ATPase